MEKPSAAKVFSQFALTEEAAKAEVVTVGPKDDGKPSAADIAMVKKILDDPKMPAVAEPGMAYVVHWADGRGVFAVRKKTSLKKWLTKTGEMAEIVSIKYMKPEHKGKTLKVTEAEDPTQTPAFKAWFGKSKVVGKDGKPLQVYHGTTKNFDKFKKTSPIFLAVDGAVASEYPATGSGKDVLPGQRTLPLYAKAEKPLVASKKNLIKLHGLIGKDLVEKITPEDFANGFEDASGEIRDAVFAYAKQHGYDSVYLPKDTMPVSGSDDWDHIPTWAVFSPSQVKSAIGNKGTFDPASPKLTESREVALAKGLLIEAVFTAKDLDLEKTYGTFKASYEKQTGKAWEKDKFLERMGNWTLYGDHDGFVAARQQASGPTKLVGAAGNPAGVRKGFQELLATNKPIWGAMDIRLASIAARMGMRMPPAWIMRRILTAIKDQFAVASGVDPSAIVVNKDGSLTIDYPDVGKATKFIVGNKQYFEWLLKNKGSSLPAMLRTAISYFMTTGKPPAEPEGDEDQSIV